MDDLLATNSLHAALNAPMETTVTEAPAADALDHERDWRCVGAVPQRRWVHALHACQVAGLHCPGAVRGRCPPPSPEGKPQRVYVVIGAAAGGAVRGWGAPQKAI